MELKIDKWVYILDYINENEDCPIVNIARDLDITYSHVSKLTKELERRKIIMTLRSGRRVLNRLTKKGKELAGYCVGLLNYIGR